MKYRVSDGNGEIEIDPIGNLDFDAHRMAGKVGDVRREIQERFGLVSVPGK